MLLGVLCNFVACFHYHHHGKRSPRNILALTAASYSRPEGCFSYIAQVSQVALEEVWYIASAAKKENAMQGVNQKNCIQFLLA